MGVALQALCGVPNHAHHPNAHLRLVLRSVLASTLQDSIDTSLSAIYLRAYTVYIRTMPRLSLQLPPTLRYTTSTN